VRRSTSAPTGARCWSTSPTAWRHDRQDGNGDAHLKAGLVGPAETIPLIDGRLGLSQWQNIFLCKFDGPRQTRQIVCTVIADERPGTHDRPDTGKDLEP